MGKPALLLPPVSGYQQRDARRFVPIILKHKFNSLLPLKRYCVHFLFPPVFFTALTPVIIEVFATYSLAGLGLRMIRSSLLRSVPEELNGLLGFPSYPPQSGAQASVVEPSHGLHPFLEHLVCILGEPFVERGNFWWRRQLRAILHPARQVSNETHMPCRRPSAQLKKPCTARDLDPAACPHKGLAVCDNAAGQQLTEQAVSLSRRTKR